MLSALSFDADQTLWDFRGVQERALEATIAAMVERGDVVAGSLDVAALIDARAEVVEGFRGRPHRLEEVRRQSFRLVLDQAGHARADAAADELLEIFLAVRFDQIRLFPEVREALLRVKRTHRIGLLSNGNTYPERCGLPGVFDVVVLGPDHGFEKPDPRAFEMVAAGLGVEPGCLVHVGDDWDDIVGANRVGATSVYINREGADPEFRGEADHEIRDLTDLEALLAR